MILQETYTLANGIAIPKLGLGTWFIDNNKAAQAVRTAVELGYRLIDTAQAYGNEQGVGEGIRTCGLKREELHRTEDIEKGIATMILNIRGRLLVLPNKLAPAMAAMDGDQGAIFDALEQAIREALEGLKSLEWNGEENNM